MPIKKIRNNHGSETMNRVIMKRTVILICILAIVLLGVKLYRESVLYAKKNIAKTQKEITKIIAENTDVLSRLESKIYPLENEVQAFASKEEGVKINIGEEELSAQQKDLLAEVSEIIGYGKVHLYWENGIKILVITFPDVQITKKEVYIPYIFYCEDNIEKIPRDGAEISPNWYYCQIFEI